MNVIQLMSGADGGRKLMRVKNGSSASERVPNSVPAWSDQTCLQRENWEKLEGEEEVKGKRT